MRLKQNQEYIVSGGLGRRAAELIPAPIVNKRPVGLKVTKRIEEFDWVGYNTLIRKTESKLELK